MIKKNEGCTDRLIRVIIGTALLTAFYFNTDSYILLIGIIPLATGLAAWCPIYDLLKISTVCKK